MQTNHQSRVPSRTCNFHPKKNLLFSKCTKYGVRVYRSVGWNSTIQSQPVRSNCHVDPAELKQTRARCSGDVSTYTIVRGARLVSYINTPSKTSWSQWPTCRTDWVSNLSSWPREPTRVPHCYYIVDMVYMVYIVRGGRGRGECVHKAVISNAGQRVDGL